MYRTLSPAHPEEFNWDLYEYFQVEVRGLGRFDFRQGEWAIGSKPAANSAPKASSEVQKLREDIQKQELMRVMLEQMIVERTLELKTLRRELASFIISNEDVFRGSELLQASLDAREKERAEQATPQESSIERISTGRLQDDDEDDQSFSRLDDRRTPPSKPPKYFRSGSPNRMLSA